jgi:hypothetical protein
MVSAAIPLNVGHALFAVVAEERIVVVSQQPDQVVGTIPGPGKHPEHSATSPGVDQELLLDGSATKAATALARRERSS